MTRDGQAGFFQESNHNSKLNKTKESVLYNHSLRENEDPFLFFTTSVTQNESAEMKTS